MKYTDVVGSMIDLKSLANIPVPGEKTCECSSYNKLSKYNVETGVYENWSQNWDEGYDAPRDEENGYIITLPKKGAYVIYEKEKNKSKKIEEIKSYISSIKEDISYNDILNLINEIYGRD